MNNKENILYDLHLNYDSENRECTFPTYFLPNEEKHIEYLPSVNDINIFIGSNNSGKSRFMRELIKLDNWFYSSDLINTIGEFNNQAALLTERYNKLRQYNTIDANDFKIKLNSIINFEPHLRQVNEKLNSIQYFRSDRLIKDLLNRINENLPEKSKLFSKTFIPTLRSAHSLFQVSTNSKKIEEDFFKDTIEKNYNLKNSRIEIFTGLHLYKNILNARNSGKENRKKFEEFEKFIGEYFFNKKTIDIVAEYNFDSNTKGDNTNNNITIHIEGETDRKLYELGDGIQALIILMFKIYMADNNSYIFIDEPEINLHPGMQRLFLDQICNNKILKEKNLKYFISTHSNHFLDLSIEKNNVSIYAFSQRNSDNTKEKQFEIRNVNKGDNSILRDIGVNNSSVFLANCSIWVEGVSDRNYIKAFLKAYIDDASNKAEILKEDIDFAFFEYAGSNIDHYIFEPLSFEIEEDIKKNINALALNNKIFLVADSDNASGETLKAARLNKLKENSNIKTKVLTNIREIENILPTDIWIEAIDFYCNSSLIRKNEVEATDKIKKSINKIKPEDYKKKYIGEFLNDLRNDVGKDGKEYFINKSVYKTNNSIPGTLVNKRGLSELVLDKNISWDIYKKSKEIVSLTTSIYNFIKENKI